MKSTTVRLAAAALAAVFAAAGPPSARQGESRRISARDLKADFRTDGEAMFGRPVSISHDADAIYVVDAEAHEIRTFSKDGAFLGALGKKGRGPGEFNAPSDLDARDGRLYVADKFNDRVQVLDKKGRYLEGFRVPFSPDQVCALDGGKIALSHLPLGLGGSEPMIHCYSGKGELLWEGLASYSSGDRTYDAFRNLLVMVGGGRDGLYLVLKSDERAIRRFDGSGRPLPPITVSASYAFKNLTLPLKGPNRLLRAFCWDASFDNGRIGLLAPDYTDEGDVGPGRLIYLLGSGGEVATVLELPSAVRRIDLDGDRVYAIDEDHNLRIFATGPR